MNRSAYSEKLRDPRWQKKRLEMLQRDEWACRMCFETEKTLSVHHRYYINGNEPWDYPDSALVTLCQDCHDQEHAEQAEAMRALKTALADRGLFGADIFNLAQVFQTSRIYFFNNRFDVLLWHLYELLHAMDDEGKFKELKRVYLEKTELKASEPANEL